MDITPLYSRVIGLDVHQAKISACALIEQLDGSVTVEHREFGTFKRDLRALAEWASALGPELVVMESTGVYWKSPYAALDGLRVFGPGWSMPAMSKPCRGGRRISPMPSGWRFWRGPVCCGVPLSHRLNCASCA